jgi:hypothetical protein
MAHEAVEKVVSDCSGGLRPPKFSIEMTTGAHRAPLQTRFSTPSKEAVEKVAFVSGKFLQFVVAVV